jgi:hypothetical protein
MYVHAWFISLHVVPLAIFLLVLHMRGKKLKF